MSALERKCGVRSLTHSFSGCLRSTGSEPDPVLGAGDTADVPKLPREDRRSAGRSECRW